MSDSERDVAVGEGRKMFARGDEEQLEDDETALALEHHQNHENGTISAECTGEETLVFVVLNIAPNTTLTFMAWLNSILYASFLDKISWGFFLQFIEENVHHTTRVHDRNGTFNL